MQEPTEASVLGRFDGAVFRKGAVETLFYRKDAKFLIRTEGPDGKAGDFPVRYVFGVEPLQQYLIELPGGRLQAFGIAWDSRPAAQGGRRWRDLYPDRKMAAGDPLHWTGVDQNWNDQCAWRHSTNLRKNYNAASGAFSTAFSEISVGCEARHGPAATYAMEARVKTVKAQALVGYAFGRQATPSIAIFRYRFFLRVVYASSSGTQPQVLTGSETQLCVGLHGAALLAFSLRCIWRHLRRMRNVQFFLARHRSNESGRSGPAA